MKKKTIIISSIVLVLLIIIISVFLLFKKNDGKLYLSDEFYGNGVFSEINANNINKYSNKTYLLFTYNNYCNFQIPCDKIFQTFAKDNNIELLSISYAEYKNTKFVKEVKYAPSVIIISNNKVVAYLDAEKDSDLEYYQNVDAFKSWVETYVYLQK